MWATALSGTLHHEHDVGCIHLSKTRYGRCIAATQEVWKTSFCVYSWCRLCQTMLSQRPQARCCRPHQLCASGQYSVKPLRRYRGNVDYYFGYLVSLLKPLCDRMLSWATSTSSMAWARARYPGQLPQHLFIVSTRSSSRWLSEGLRAHSWVTYLIEGRATDKRHRDVHPRRPDTSHIPPCPPHPIRLSMTSFRRIRCGQLR